MSFKHQIAGCMNMLPKKERGMVMGIVSLYYMRNGKKHNDGSEGEIKITPNEFCDLLAALAIGGEYEQSKSIDESVDSDRGEEPDGAGGDCGSDER